MTEPPPYPPGNPDPSGADHNDPLSKHTPSGAGDPGQAPGSYPPPGQDGAPQPEYGASQPEYGAAQQQYGTPPPAYGTPQPGYGPPPGGSTGYGDPAAGYPPPPGGYGAAGGAASGIGAAGVNVGEALSWAWAKFKEKPLPAILPGLLAVLSAVIFIAVFFASGITSTETTTNYIGDYAVSTTTQSSVSSGGLVAIIVVFILLIAASIYLSASMATGALRVADGEPITMSTFLVPKRLGAVIGTSILVAIITTIGFVLCVIPGLIAIFLLQFAIFIVIDKPQISVTQSLGASSRLARSSVSNSILTLVVSYALSYVGALLVYIGLIVTWPIGQLFYAHCYRRLSGGYIAPAKS
ncbi:DUF2189 domain-containing protein [Gordonia sinesedis]